MSAPKWRIAIHGLNLEGICVNKNCQAYNQWVIVKKGLGIYDIIYDQFTNICPVCSEYVDSKKCAFSNCKFNYTGIKLVSGKPPQKVMSKKETTVGDHYLLFDPAETGEVNWLSLKICTKMSYGDKVEVENSCGICKKKMSASKRIAKCGHLFHDECQQKIQNLNIACVFCHL